MIVTIALSLLYVFIFIVDNSLYRLSALTQTSCLILTSELITHGANKKPTYIEILDHLIKQRYVYRYIYFLNF